MTEDEVELRVEFLKFRELSPVLRVELRVDSGVNYGSGVFDLCCMSHYLVFIFEKITHEVGADCILFIDFNYIRSGF